ncbi:unnamed protein product [Lymnaea stagnalis]|uniref:Contactin n=1 Tax=Lymnaea stagnalis TaxID=6523 RepID=A0AAV2IM49_LYMST
MGRTSLKTLCITLVQFIMIIHHVTGQHDVACPPVWFEYSGHCYKFVLSPERTFQEAAIVCQQDMSSLVSVNSAGEHGFIQNWLNTHDGHRMQWFTSGLRETGGAIVWDSDGSQADTTYFDDERRQNEKLVDVLTGLENNVVVYKYSAAANNYLWAWSRLMKTGSFVCEMDKSDVWKLYQQQRDFSYGTNTSDPNLWERGPSISFISPDTVFYEVAGRTSTVVLECVASGNPRPTYKWVRPSTNRQQDEDVNSDLDPRYDVTNGRLTIHNPDPAKDVSSYTCVVSNALGTVMSTPVELSYGYLGQFPNVKPSPVQATMYMGKDVICQAPTHNTDLRYSWYKSSFNFIRPELNAQYFLSRNGGLYISEVQAADQDEYYCMVFMAPRSGHVLAGEQPPSRTSMGIQLVVTGENANTYGPDIQDKFPQYFPAVPMVGDDVDIECLAYGRLPLYYSWVREDGPLHPRAYTKDHNRVLVIPSARLEDTGIYTCVVRGDRNTVNKTVVLSLKAPPRFPFPLHNQHVDVGATLTWTCAAIGVPKPTYTWYKNGRILKSEDGIKVQRNMLVIDKVEPGRHEGMYECQANNVMGLARTAAQLRALYFAPTFTRSPVERSKLASKGGNITISCQPQAAPRAQITWLKNGVEVGSVLPDGALQLSSLTIADSGNYTCVASNVLGEARATCLLSVQEQTVFTQVPSHQNINQNETAVLHCKASFDRSVLDAVYYWKFYSHVIDLSHTSEDRAHYSMPSSQDTGMLYVIAAQFEHEGEYTCVVSTVTGSLETRAFLGVKGAPGEPIGVHVREPSNASLTFNNLALWWKDGLGHGYPVTKYCIEMLSIHENGWKTWRADIPVHLTVINEFPEWRGFDIETGLSPGTSYQFRVKAGNDQVGYGPASFGPYKWYTMAAAPPVVAPSNVGGGGGSVGLLIITWNPLSRSLWGGNQVHYCVYYRPQHMRDAYGKWIQVDNITVSYLHTLVGTDNYYLPYEVKVQAINEKGMGPNSSITIVYSADEMPTNIAPIFVSASAINGTAGIIKWKPVPDTRETAKGKVFGYQVNYWLEGNTRCLGQYEDQALSNNFYGDVSEGLLVGMEYSGDYCVNIQFINHAGMGPKTDNYYLGMNDAPPGLYPEYVTVMSHGNESVRLVWRGISTRFGEDPLQGYKVWWWDASEDIRTARISTYGRVTTGVIHGVERDIIYKLRILGYSNGGDGKKSPDVFFTLGGQVPFDPSTTDIMNSALTIQQAPIIRVFTVYIWFCLIISL